MDTVNTHKANKGTGSLFTADCRLKRKADMEGDTPFTWWKLLTDEDW